MARRKITNYKLDIRNIWFPNQREPLREDKIEFRRYWKRERHRIKNGFWIADSQVYIPGWLYWHTVYWVIELDYKDEVTGKSWKTKGTPLFRDLEWEIATDIEEAEKQQKMYILVGSRGFGKSNFCASIVGRIYNFYEDSECVISGGFDNDNKLLAQKIDLGLSNVHPIFFKQRLLANWKAEVRAGWIDQATKLRKGSNSRILTRNYEEGNNTMATNGTRPKVHIIDEIGKIPHLENCVLDSMPCWMNDYGMFSIPILAGTGGDMEVGEDAAKLFRNPGTYNILEFDDIWEGSGKIGKFIPVTKARNEFKHWWSLYDYLTIIQKMDLNPHPDLNVQIMVSDEQECMDKYVTPRREKALRSTTSNAIIKEKAYYPLTPSESFLTITANDFPVEAIKQHKMFLEKEQFKSRRVDLYMGLDGKVKFKDSERFPISVFPIQADTDKTGVVEMIEPPIDNPPYGLYVGGIDPYKISESDYSDSAGAVIIFKRMTTSMNDPFQNMPIAWYTGRPKDIHDWYENVRMLLKLYGAKGMCENIDYGFIQYMISKKESYYMAEGLSFLREISPGSKSKSAIGLPPTTTMINHWNNTAVQYAKEEIVKERDEEGNIKRTVLGCSRILDPMLLEEMGKFNKNKGNFDRIRAFSIAVAYAQQLDALIPPIVLQEEERKIQKIIRSPFMMKQNHNYKKNAPSRSPFNVDRRHL